MIALSFWMSILKDWKRRINVNLTTEQLEFLNKELNLTEEEIVAMDKEQWMDIREKCFMIEGDEAPVDATPTSDRGRIAADIADITFKKLHAEQSSTAAMSRISDDEIFEDLGFEKVEFDTGVVCYKGRDDGFYRVDYCAGLHSYITEFAENEEEARNNMFEDDDLFDDLLPREQLLGYIRTALKEYVEEFMLDLRLYEFKNVIVRCRNGEVIKGYVDAFFEAEDNDFDENTIAIISKEGESDGIEISQLEIQSIEIVE